MSSISVIIPLYNHANTIADCIASIQAQTVKVSEIIVVDDGSTDSGGDAAEVLGVQVIRQKNAGAPAARNRGFEASTGEYVIFCDADVLMKSDMLETMLTGLKAHPEASFAYSGFIFGTKVFRGLPFSNERLHEINYIHTTTLIRRDDFPGFDPKIKRLQDWDLWLTMVKNGKQGICVSEDPLFTVQIDGPSRIGSNWLPKIFYKLPWKWIGWAPKPVASYFKAREILAEKHPEIK